MFWNRGVEGNFEDAEIRRYTDTLRGIFAVPGGPTAPSEQIIYGVRPAVQDALRADPAFATLGNRIRVMEEHDRRTEHWHGGNMLFSPITKRRPRPTPADLVSDVQKDINLAWWMSQRNIGPILNSAPFNDIRNLLHRRLGPDIFDALEDQPETRYAIALSFSQGGTPLNPANILAFLTAAIGDAGDVTNFTDEDRSKRDLDTVNSDLENANSYSNKIPEAIRPLTSGGGSIGTALPALDAEITSLRPPAVPTPSREQAKRLSELEARMDKLQENRQKLQTESNKILEMANNFTAYYPGGIPGAVLPSIQLLQAYLSDPGAFPVPGGIALPVLLPGTAPGVNWTGYGVASWQSIENCINFMNSPAFATAVNNLRPFLQHTKTRREREYRRAKTGLEVSQSGLDSTISSKEFMYRVWRQMGRGNPPGPAGDLDEETIRKRATMATMMSLTEARDQDLLQTKNKIRAEQMYRNSSLFRRVFNKYNFAPSAQTVLNRMKHISITKEGKDVKPFAQLDLKTTTTRTQLRKAVAEGKLASEDIPRLYLHLEAVLKNFEKNTIKLNDTICLIDLVQSLKILRTEMLHKDLLEQFRNNEGTPQANMIKLLETKMTEEDKWVKQLGDDILRGEFLKTITPKNIKAEKKAMLREIKKKMNSGEMGYEDAVKLMKENGFAPGVFRKLGLGGRKFKNWFSPRNKIPGKPGLIKKTGSGLWTVGTAPVKLGWWLAKPARLVLGRSLGYIGRGLSHLVPLKKTWRNSWKVNVNKVTSGMFGLANNPVTA